jgi:flagellar hook-associated protein 2
MSAVTFSGFNSIDFNTILNAVITQERVPIDNLEAQQTKLKTQSTAFSTLATKLGALGTAGEALANKSAFGGRDVTSTDASAVAATGSTGAIPGIYDVVVRELARAQVTASSSRAANTDETIVATGGSMTIGGKTVTLSGGVTLEGLADAINGTDDIGVTASIVNTIGGYQLVLTGKSTGTANAFTVTNALTGSAVAFTDTDTDGVSGDSAADNAMQATDADLLINNIAVTSATNTIEGAIPGTTLTVLRKQPGTTVTISVTETTDTTNELVKGFVAAYNALMTWGQQQSGGTDGGITRDPLFRSLKSELRGVLTGGYDAGGTLESLGQAGVEFDRTGKLTINQALLTKALTDSPDNLRALFMGDGTNRGVFETLGSTIQRYTDPGALLSSTQDRIEDQIASMDRRLADMEERLENRRVALQKEYIAADLLITQLNSDAGSLSSLGSQYSLF